MIKTTIALLICIVFIFSAVAKTYLGPVYSYVQIITLLGGVMICLKTLLSRCEKSIMIINTDDKVEQNTLDKIAKINGIYESNYIRLNV